MKLSKIKNTQIYHVSAGSTKGLGDVLVEGSIVELLTFVQTKLIVAAEDIPDDEVYIDEDGTETIISSYLTATDFQSDAVFTYLGTASQVITDHKWFVTKLSDTLYQISLTEEGLTTRLAVRSIWSGSLNDLISLVFSELNG